MPAIDFSLSVLKFLSIGLTGFFSILALIKPYRDKEGNLTRSGKIAVRGAVISFIMAVASQSLELQRSHKQALSSQNKTQSELARFERLLQEVQRTAPLTFLSIRLVVDNVPDSVVNAITAGLKLADNRLSDSDYIDLALHHNVDDEDGRRLIQSVKNNSAIFPFIHWLAAGTFVNEPSFLTVGLDNRLSSFFCIGWVEPEMTGIDGPGTYSSLPSGILIGDEKEWGPSVYKPLHQYRNRSLNMPSTDISVSGNTVTLSAEMDPLSLQDAVIRHSSKGSITGFLPDDILCFTWASLKNSDEKDLYDYINLPVDSSGVSSDVLGSSGSTDSVFAKRSSLSQIPMKIGLIPNNAEKLLRLYKISLLNESEHYEGPRGDDYGGYFRFWLGHSDD